MLRLTSGYLLLLSLVLNQTLAAVGVANPKSQHWSTVGTEGFSAGMVSHLSLSSVSSGRLSLAYSDKANGNKATVKSFDQKAWVSIGGEGITTSAASHNSLKLDSSGKMYLAFQDASQARKTSVLRFNGTNWVNVGQAGISAGIATHQSLVIDDQNRLYVAYADYAANQRSTVLMNNGDNNWSAAGFPGFTGAPASYQSLAVNSSGQVYLAYRDGSYASKATAMEFKNGINWIAAGNPGLSLSAVEYLSLAMSASGHPLLAYSDAANGHKATVMGFDGKTWNAVGGTGISDGKASFLSLALDSSGTPYLAFQDYANGGRATIMKYTDAQWTVVGAAGFSKDKADFQSLTIISDIPYLAFRDHSVNGKATVVKLVDTYPVDVFENETFATEVSATGVAPFSFNIVGGSDASQFLLDELSGELSFVVAPDFEKPSDVNLDNLYEVTVRITDATGEFKEGDFRVRVIDVIEKPKTGCGSNETLVWDYVGEPGFSDGVVSWSSIAFNSMRKPYIAYADSTVGGRVSVQKFEDSEWVTVGTHGFSPAEVEYVSLAMGPDDVPYVAYSDSSMMKRVAVMKYDGTSWVPVGVVDGISALHRYVQLAFDAEGVLYVAYQGGGAQPSLQHRATVKRFNGTSWVTVGSEGFTTTKAYWLSLAFDNTNAPLLAYSQGISFPSSTHVSVVRFDGSEWSFVGSPQFALGERLSLAVDSKNDLYVSMRYMGLNPLLGTRVMRFSGSDWTAIGMAPGVPAFSSMKIDSYDVPVLGVHMDMPSREVSVRRFDDTDFTNLGVLGKANPSISGAMSFGLDSENTPYVFFRDESNNNLATVQRLACTVADGANQ